MNSTDPSDIRRQVYDLSVLDLRDWSAWEFASDEEGFPDQDEATVRPYTKIPIDPGDGLLVVRAAFRLADGTDLIGYISPPPPGTSWDLSSRQPVIVMQGGQVPMWFGMRQPSPEDIQGFLATLGKTNAHVFPLVYKSDASVVGGPVEGQVDGFCFLSQGRVTAIS